ncbi:DUF6263 family protein [Rhodocaloribacter sp.]
MNRFKKTVGSLLLLTVLVASAAFHNDKVTLRLHLKEGDSYRLYNLIDQDINQVVMGQEQAVKQQIGMGYQYDVLSAGEGVYRVKATYYRVYFKQSGPMGEILYDSENPPETLPMQAKGLAGLLGQSLTLTFDEMGHVQDVEGVDEMLADIMKQFEGVDPAMKAQMEQGMRRQFGVDAIKSQMETTFAIYPEDPVGVGDTWTRDLTLNGGLLPMKISATYRLEAIEDGQAKLAVESNITGASDEPMNMGGMEIELDLSGTQNGTVLMEVPTGMVVDSELEQRVSGDMIVNDGAMTWPLDMKTKNTLKREQ